MNRQLAKELILKKFPDAKVEIEGEDCNFSIKVITKAFVGVSSINRHRLINQIFKSKIESGELHALSISTGIPAAD